MSWLKDRFQELTAQVKMGDNRTASTVRAARKTQPAQTKKYTGNPDSQPGFQVTNNSLTRGLSRGYDQANTLDDNRTWKQRSPDTQVKSALQQAMANPVGGFNAARGAGLARSAIGTGQALSGLYDLATPGTGTNRLSKQLDQYGKNTDKFVKDNNLNTGVYKVQQGLGDVAQAFAGGAGLAKAGAQVATKVPVVAKGANILGNANRMVNSGVTQATMKLAGGNFGQRVTAGAVRNMANPKYQAANVGWNSVQMGKDASQGKDISPQRVALDTAIGGVGLPVAGAIAGQTGRSVANKVIPTLDRKMGGVNKAIPGTSLTFTNKNGVLVPQTTTKLAGQSIIRKVTDVKNQILDTNRMLKENQGGYVQAGKPFNAFQDITTATKRPESTKQVLKNGGSPVYHDTDSRGIMGILDSGEIRTSQAPFSSIIGQGKRVSTTRNFDNYSRYGKAPYRLTLDERKIQQKGIPDNKDEFETIFNKNIPTKNVETLSIDITNPALISDMQNGTLAEVIAKAKAKGMKIEAFEGKKLPNEYSNAEVQQMTKDMFGSKYANLLEQPKPKFGLTPLKNNQGGFVKVGKGETPKVPTLNEAQDKISGKGGFANLDNAPLEQRNAYAAEELGGTLKLNKEYIYKNATEKGIDLQPYLDELDSGKSPLEMSNKVMGAVSGKQPLGETTPVSQAIPQGKPQQPMQSRSPQNQPEQSLAFQGQTPQQIVQGKIEEQKLGNSSSPYAESIPQTGTNVKVTQPNNGSKIPVRKEVMQGDTLTRTNVNPNIKAREQRFSVADDGSLLPDTKGATRVFTNSKGAVTNIRVGDEVYNLKDIGDLTNIKNYGSTVATQRRNIERAFKDNPTTGKRVNELVVDFQQEQATKMIVRQKNLQDGMKQLTDELGISFGVGRHNAKKVSAAIQDFGEKKRNYDSLVKEFGQQKADTIVKADNWFRSQYDQLLNEANKELTKYGYDPIPKRDNYYTHFSEPTLWQKFGLKMQEVNDAFGSPIQEATPGGGRGSIPNTLAGQSEYMVPNKKFNRFALRRKGDERTADAFQSFEKYINPTLNNIYMTPAITRARVMTKAIAMENDRVGKDANQVVVQMTEWANHLAGKSNRLGDRQAADTTGFRQALQASNWVQRKVGANSIVGNVATAVIQPIVLAQTAGKAGYKNTMLALLQEASTSHKANAAIRQSEFMKRRYTNLSPVSRGKVQRSADVASVPLRVIEETAGRVTWQANYNKALEQGLKGKQAIKFADVEAEKTMAGRAIGEKPELYRSKAAGFATQFQLEVNNYVQQVGKEMTPAQVAKTFTAAYGINLLIQQATGRSIGFNPIDAAVDSVEILAGDDDEKAKKVAQRWGGEIAGNAPVVSSVLDTLMSDDLTKKVFGNETPIGRFGVGSPYSSMVDNTVGKVVKGKPLEAAAYLASPFGYSQVNKTTSGVSAVLKGEMTDKDGNTTVEVPQTAGNFVRGALFGPSAIKEVNQYYNNIGVKKEDQKPVQNQTDSKAAKMGAIGTKGTVDVKDQIKQAFTTPEGKKFLAMNEDEKKNHEYYTQYKAMQTGLKTEANKDDRPENYDKLSKGAKSVYDEQINLTKEGKEKWLKAKVNSKTAEAYRAINSMKPAGFPDLPNNNKVATILANYESKSGEWNNTQKNIEKNKALREAYGSELDDNDKWMLDASTAQAQQAIDNGDLSIEKLKQLVAYDNLSIQLGGSAKISKALRAKYGLGYAPSTSSGGSGRSGGSRKKASKYDYTKNLFDSGTSSSDVSKSLRSILEKAMAG